MKKKIIYILESLLTHFVNSFANIVVKACRSPSEEQDKFIFDLFRLGSAKEVTREHLTIMLYNLPSCGVICPSKSKSGTENKTKVASGINSYYSIDLFVMKEFSTEESS